DSSDARKRPARDADRGVRRRPRRARPRTCRLVRGLHRPDPGLQRRGARDRPRLLDLRARRRPRPQRGARRRSCLTRTVPGVSARVVRISIAPVKSLGLVHPDEVVLEPFGVRGNRRFWLVDETGRLFNGKLGGPLVQIRPDWDEETRVLALAFPDGRRVEGTIELGERVDALMYGHPHPSRRVVGPWETAISEFAGRQLT